MSNRLTFTGLNFRQGTANRAAALSKRGQGGTILSIRNGAYAMMRREDVSLSLEERESVVAMRQPQKIEDVKSFYPFDPREIITIKAGKYDNLTIGSDIPYTISLKIDASLILLTVGLLRRFSINFIVRNYRLGLPEHCWLRWSNLQTIDDAHYGAVDALIKQMNWELKNSGIYVGLPSQDVMIVALEKYEDELANKTYREESMQQSYQLRQYIDSPIGEVYPEGDGIPFPILTSTPFKEGSVKSYDGPVYGERRVIVLERDYDTKSYIRKSGSYGGAFLQIVER